MENEPQENSYFISIADLMTGLLFIFLIFIFYFAIQQVDFSKMQEFLDKNPDAIEEFPKLIDQIGKLEKEKDRAEKEKDKAIKEKDRAEKEANQIKEIYIQVNNTKKEILKKLKNNLSKSNINVEIDLENGILRLPQGEIFKSAEYVPTVIGKRKLAILSTILSDIVICYSNSSDQSVLKSKKFKCDVNDNLDFKIEAIFLEGHADRQPVKSNQFFKNNQELSAKRALEAFEIINKNSIISKLTNSKKQFLLSVSGYGEKRLICKEESKLCDNKNRRIDLRFIMESPKIETPN